MGGIEKHIQSFCTHLERLGHECFIALPNGIFLPSQLQPDPNTELAFERYFWPQLLSLGEIWKRLRQLQLDILHVHSYWVYPFTNILLMIGHSTAKVVVWTPHLSLPTELSLRNFLPLPSRLALEIHHSILGPALLRRVDGIVALSEGERELYSSWGLKDVIVIPNGIDVSSFSGLVRHPPSLPLRLLSVGRVCPEKGIETLIQAASILKHRGTPFHLRIVGPITNRAFAAECIRSMKMNGLGEEVEFVGARMGSDLLTEYAEADLLLNSSYYETQPLTVLEALAAGLPVIATDTGFTRDLVGHDGGILVRVRDQEGLAEAIESLAGDRTKMVNFSIAGKRRALAYDIESLTRKLDQYYRHLMECERDDVLS